MAYQSLSIKDKHSSIASQKSSKKQTPTDPHQVSTQLLEQLTAVFNRMEPLQQQHIHLTQRRLTKTVELELTNLLNELEKCVLEATELFDLIFVHNQKLAEADLPTIDSLGHFIKRGV